MTVLLIGDRPSRKNLDPNVAFIGTQSHTTLLDWCAQLGIENPYFANQIDIGLKRRVLNATALNVPIIALGTAAKTRLQKLHINHFCLPHPSGRNRLLNDKFALELQLEACRDWLYKAKQKAAGG